MGQANLGYIPIVSSPQRGFTLTAHAWTIVGIMSALMVGALVLGAIAATLNQQEDNPIVLVISVLGVLVALGMLALYGWWISRMWYVVREELRTLSPTTAVLISLIPIVHCVGMFLAFWGLAKCLNAEARARNMPQFRVSEGMALAACICYISGTIFGLIPLIEYVFTPVRFVGMVLWMVGIVKMSVFADRLFAMNAPTR